MQRGKMLAALFCLFTVEGSAGARFQNTFLSFGSFTDFF
jgi:hypothetical protein